MHKKESTNLGRYAYESLFLIYWAHKSKKVHIFLVARKKKAKDSVFYCQA